MIPSSFKPKVSADFVGPAALIARQLEALAKLAEGSPVAVLLHGPPGVGKSQLAAFFVRCLGAERTVHKYNGTDIRIEEVNSMARDLHYRDMFGKTRVWQIEEVDKVPTVAQVRLLTLLDDMPSGTAFVCTTNVNPEKLEERFQTRFTVITVPAPPSSEIAALLKALNVLPQAAVRIAELCCGNVRAALKDADAELSARMAMKGST